MFFAGFHYEEMTLAGTRYRLRIGGLAGWKAAPLLLLHGQPQTHVMWHQVAPALGDATCPRTLPWTSSHRTCWH